MIRVGRPVNVLGRVRQVHPSHLARLFRQVSDEHGERGEETDTALGVKY